MMSRRGQAVVLAYVTVVVLTVLGGSLLNHALTAHQQSQAQGFQADVFYDAEGGLEDAISRFAQAVADFQVSSTTSRYPATGSLTTTFASGATASSIIQEVSPGQTPFTDPDGIALFVKNYHITTTVQHPTNASVSVTLHQMFTRRIIYTFQHAVFYDQDLEWLPGPNMTLSGRVHSNSDIYLGANNTLTVDTEYLKSASNLYHKRKDDGSVPAGTVKIKKAGSSPVVYPSLTFDSTSPTWTTDSQTTWNGTVQTSANGVTKRAVPVVGDIAPGGFYDTNANLKVTNDPIDPTKCLIKENGTTLTEGVSIPIGTCTSTTTLYNNREGKTIKMLNVDLTRLAGGTYSGVTYANHLPGNGLIYATRDDTPSNQEPGVRLLSGAEIKRGGGLTVVSNLPMYIQGDYNTVSKKPVAVIADALNLLSNNWSDGNSSSSLSSRAATSTTVNSAFIAGIKTTTSGHYNGGLENYPRLHESWTGVTLTITGSFVSLWNSQIATGNWLYGAPQYTAPIRTWSWDSSFGSGSNMPPFTPWAVEIVKGAWWKE